MENQFEEILEIHNALKQKIRDTEQRAIQSGIIEVWKPIKDFPKYEVSSYGNIKNLVIEKYYKDLGYATNDAEFLKGHVHSSGLNTVIQGQYPISKPVYFHRVVAEAFIPNPQNKRIVSHRDGNKLNNNVSNLYWR